MESDTSIKRAAKLIKDADALIFTNGAGLGVDSGLATFRGRNQEDSGWGPITRDVESPYSMAKPRRVDEDPCLAWGYSAYRCNAFKATEPHNGYHIMRQWGQSKRIGYAVYTSNIDGHWRRVLQNDPAVPLVECHGSIDLMQCHVDCQLMTWETDFASIANTTIDPETGKCNMESLPMCPYCKGPSRFNVCLVADNHFNKIRFDHQTAHWEAFLTEKLSKTLKIVVVEVGAGTNIPTIRRLSAALTRRFGATLVRINLDDPELDRSVDIGHLIQNNVHVSIGTLGALDALARIDEEIKKE